MCVCVCMYVCVCVYVCMHVYNFELCADVGVCDCLTCRTVCGLKKGIGFVII
jgi:hypothetical protein